VKVCNGIALPFYIGTRWKSVVSFIFQSIYPQRKYIPTLIGQTDSSEDKTPLVMS
jgi:hypothetical protein